MYIREIIKAANKNIKIKNCHLCRYHSIDNFDIKSYSVFCKIFKEKKDNSNDAAECEYFKIDKKCFTTIYG